MKRKQKIYKNPDRNKIKENPQDYVPSYKILGIVPEQSPLTKLNNVEKSMPENINISDSENQSNTTLNIGNNSDHIWYGVDGGEISQNIDPNHKMIDNNDFYVEDHKNADKIISASLSSIKDNDCVLLINEEIISVDTLENIENLANLFLFGEHELCNGVPTPLEKITVLKKLRIKTGLFIDP